MNPYKCCECDKTFGKSELLEMDTPDGIKYICEPCEEKRQSKVNKAREFLIAIQNFGMYCDQTANNEIFISGDESEFWDFVVAHVSEKENL